MLEAIGAVALIFVLARIRHWAYWGRGRWIGVKPPNNVIPFRKRTVGGRSE